MVKKPRLLEFLIMMSNELTQPMKSKHDKVDKRRCLEFGVIEGNGQSKPMSGEYESGPNTDKSDSEGCLILKCGSEKEHYKRLYFPGSEDLGLSKDTEPEKERKV